MTDDAAPSVCALLCLTACSAARKLAERALTRLQVGDAVRCARQITLEGGHVLLQGAFGVVVTPAQHEDGTIEARVNGYVFDAGIDDVEPVIAADDNPLGSGVWKKAATPHQIRKQQQEKKVVVSTEGQQQQQPKRSSGLLCCFGGGDTADEPAGFSASSSTSSSSSSSSSVTLRELKQQQPVQAGAMLDTAASLPGPMSHVTSATSIAFLEQSASAHHPTPNSTNLKASNVFSASSSFSKAATSLLPISVQESDLSSSSSSSHRSVSRSSGSSKHKSTEPADADQAEPETLPPPPPPPPPPAPTPLVVPPQSHGRTPSPSLSSNSFMTDPATGLMLAIKKPPTPVEPGEVNLRPSGSWVKLDQKGVPTTPRGSPTKRPPTPVADEGGGGLQRLAGSWRRVDSPRNSLRGTTRTPSPVSLQPPSQQQHQQEQQQKPEEKPASCSSSSSPSSPLSPQSTNKSARPTQSPVKSPPSVPPHPCTSPKSPAALLVARGRSPPPPGTYVKSPPRDPSSQSPQPPIVLKSPPSPPWPTTPRAVSRSELRRGTVPQVQEVSAPSPPEGSIERLYDAMLCGNFRLNRASASRAVNESHEARHELGLLLCSSDIGADIPHFTRFLPGSAISITDLLDTVNSVREYKGIPPLQGWKKKVKKKKGKKVKKKKQHNRRSSSTSSDMSRSGSSSSVSSLGSSSYTSSVSSAFRVVTPSQKDSHRVSLRASPEASPASVATVDVGLQTSLPALPPAALSPRSPEVMGGESHTPEPRNTPAPIPTPHTPGQAQLFGGGGGKKPLWLETIVVKHRPEDLLGLDITQDMIVVSVACEGAAHKSDFDSRCIGMVLVKVNGEPVATPEEAAAAASSSSVVRLEMERTSHIFVATTPRRRKLRRRSTSRSQSTPANVPHYMWPTTSLGPHTFRASPESPPLPPKLPRLRVRSGDTTHELPPGFMGKYRIRWTRLPQREDLEWIDSLRADPNKTRGRPQRRRRRAKSADMTHVQEQANTAVEGKAVEEHSRTSCTSANDVRGKE